MTTVLLAGEVEYYAAINAGWEIMWMQQLATNIRYLQHDSTILCSNSISALKNMMSSDEISNCTKHIQIAYHWLHKAVEANFISPKFIAGSNNTADILMKGLNWSTHEWHICNLGMAANKNAG
jgi:hypothetical protein